MDKDPTIILSRSCLGNEKNLGTSWTHARTVSGCFLRCFHSGWTAVGTAGTRWRDSTRRISGPWTMSFRTRTCFLAAEDFQLSRCCNFISFTSGGFSQRYWFDRHHIYSPFTLALTSVAMVSTSIIFKEFCLWGWRKTWSDWETTLDLRKRDSCLAW